MTPSQDRLDRIEALLEASIAQHNREMADMRAAQGASRSRVENTDRRLEAAIADTVAMVADLGRQQQETDQRFEVFLQEARADRQRSTTEREETNQRFEVFLEDSRADRQSFDQMMAANAAEHRAFTQNVQALLAEIARLSQRVAG